MHRHFTDPPTIRKHFANRSTPSRHNPIGHLGYPKKREQIDAARLAPKRWMLGGKVTTTIDKQPFFYTVAGMTRYQTRYDKVRRYHERFVEKMPS